MDFEQYQKAAMRTANPDAVTLVHASLGLAGETGEFIELVKKHEFNGKPYNREQLMDEASDVLWYLTLACEAMGVSLQSVAEANVRKLAARYPDKFTLGGGIRDGQ